MRRQPSEVRNLGTRVGRHGGRAAAKRRRFLALEGLEERRLLATSPAPTIVAHGTASSGGGTNINYSSPFIAIDPLNSQKQVTVYTDRDTGSGSAVFTTIVTYSTDGGATWSFLSQSFRSFDPTSTTGARLQDYGKGVGFDRNGNFYVGILETNGGNAGDVVVDKYSFAGATPTISNNQSYGNAVYSWDQALTNASATPTVLDFSLAVDSNYATQPGVTVGDPNSGAVYVAWTMNTPPPQSPPSPYDPYSIQVVASTDGVNWQAGGGTPTPNTFPSAMAQASYFGAGGGNQAYADPEITVSQGTTATGANAGLISVVYDDYGSASNVNLDYIGYAGLTYNGNSLAAVRRIQEITTTSVRGAQTGTAFALKTPSSPIGIGPGAVIAADNTVGSYSANQGRIYVAYVDRYTGTHDAGPGNAWGLSAAQNPADNTDIFLVYSDNGGQSWSPARQVNDDSGISDGHSSAVNPNDTTSSFDLPDYDGRPQYEPSIAVDASTGTLAMTWLDVRDDPSLDRYANYLTTSTDGGSTFSPQTYVNQPIVVTDAITSATINVAPYSGNESSNNPGAETSTSFGTNQGLAIANGVIHPVWSTTALTGLGNYNTGEANARLTIATSEATFAAGPRVVSGTMGVVGPTTVDGKTFNNAAASDGTDELTGFVVTFDRPVAVASFTASQVQVFFNGTTAATQTNAPVQVNTPTPLDSYYNGLEATTFFVPMTTPQSAVGTYSYKVGNGIYNLMDNVAGGTIVPRELMDQNANGTGGDASDYFVNPKPVSGTAVSAPFDASTEPLIIPGPHLVSTGVPNGVVDTSKASLGATDTNLVVNGTVASITVTFDRLMRAGTSAEVGSFQPADVLSIVGPDGPILVDGAFLGDGKSVTITPVNAVNGANGPAATQFTISFPATDAQSLSGTYNVVLSSALESDAGDALDTNENAGLDLLFNRVTPGDATTTTTYTAADDPQTIGSGQTVTSTITVGDTYPSTDLSVALGMIFPNYTDLTGTLTFTPQDTSKPATTLTLFSDIGGHGTTSTSTSTTILNDAAPTSIQNGSLPYLGAFQPKQLLTPIIGQTVAGTYKLTLTNAGSSSDTLSSFQLVFNHAGVDTGLGEPVADQAQTSFRIFTMSPTNSLSNTTWTAVGPASENNTANAGEATAIAVDSSDPSGNTVYVGGAGGGIWKTNDYLTTAPGGPTYVPLTTTGRAGSENISSIAIFPVNNDPTQSVILAGTGSLSLTNNSSTGVASPSRGVGFLLSTDGGAHWTLLDSTNNAIAGASGSAQWTQNSANEIPEPSVGGTGTGTGTGSTVRDDAFLGATVAKVLVDPRSQPDGDLIFYAAVSSGGQSAQAGVWRSIDSGRTWQLMRAGQATDIVFDPNSGVVNTISNPTGNLDVLYAAFANDGVYLSPNRGVGWNKMAGGVGDPQIKDDQDPVIGHTVAVNNDGLTPNGARIVLAKPSLTGSTIRNDVNSLSSSTNQDAEYETWLYAATVDSGGNFSGLYITKDDGANWTKVRLPNISFALDEALPTNNPGSPDYDVSTGLGLATIAVAVDPNNPMVVYLGGTYYNGDATAMIRVDITRLADPYSLYSSTETLGGQNLEETTSPTAIYSPTAIESRFFNEPDPIYNPYINLERNPTNPYTTNSAINVANTASFSNDGSNAWWTPFDTILANSTNVQTIVTEKDPLTGRTRLLVGDDEGVFTGVVDATGAVQSSVGGADGSRTLPTGSRNGNLQLAQFYNGASQPTTTTGSGALFYGASNSNAVPNSTATILSTGNLNWTSTDLLSIPAGSTFSTDGTDVALDQTGSGQGFYSMSPGLNRLGGRGFFQVGSTEAVATGQTSGLIQQSNAGGYSGDPQWPDGPSYNFAVNPVNAQDIILGSAAGRLFGTETGGNLWYVLANPATLDSSVIKALAYGAPAVGQQGSLDSYLLVGTTAGHIFVSTNGGGTWTNTTPDGTTTGLDGTSVERIVTDPTRGTHDVYAITQAGVYYNADTSSSSTKWVNITGDLFSQTIKAFGDANLTVQQLLNNTLAGLAVDWRYVIPGASGGPTHPVVYVSGEGGVFQTLDNGTTWTAFAGGAGAVAPQGNLPVVDVSDLDMSLGAIDPTTGHPVISASSANVLLASTYGAGDYAIRLAPIVFNTTANPIAVTAGGSGTLTYSGLSEQTAFGSTATITVEDVTNPASPIILGTAPTNAAGQFSVTASYANAPANSNPFYYDGQRKIAIFATDGSGTTGNVVTLTATNPLPTPGSPALTNGLVLASIGVTTSATPTFTYTVPNPGAGQSVTVKLIATNSQGVGNTVGTATVAGTAAGGVLTQSISDTSGEAPGTYAYTILYTAQVNGQAVQSLASGAAKVQVAGPMNLVLDPIDDSGTRGDNTTNVTQPHYYVNAVPNSTGDANLKIALVVTSGGKIVAATTPVVDPSNGGAYLQVPTPLANGTYQVFIQAFDAHNHVLSSAPAPLTISTTGPKAVPSIALLPSSDLPAGNPNMTVARAPFVYGYSDPGAIVQIYGNYAGNTNLVLLATVTAQSVANNGRPAGYYQAQLPRSLSDGTLLLAAFAYNSSGNFATGGNSVGASGLTVVPNGGGVPTPPAGAGFGVLTLTITSAVGDYTDVGAAGLGVYGPSSSNPAFANYIYAHAGTASTTFITNYGFAGNDVPVPGDYDGDGQTDPALYRTAGPQAGYWVISGSSEGPTFIPPIVPAGPNVVPAPGAYDFLGHADPAVYSVNAAGAGTWTILHFVANGGSSVSSIGFGTTNMTPVPGNYEGVFSDQLALYSTTNGGWYVRNSANGGLDPVVVVTAPQAGDVPVPGNYDNQINPATGVPYTEPAIFRPGNETYYIYNPATRQTHTFTLPRLAGQGASDVIIPAPADYTGDGKFDATIFDQNLGTWEYINSTTGAVFTQAFYGSKQDVPLTAPYQYRAQSAGVSASFRSAAVAAIPAAVPAAAPAASIGSARAAAVVVGSAAPDGSTSTGKASVRPAVAVAKASPLPISTGSSRPAQDSTSSAIEDLGPSYKGLFF